MCRTDVEKTPHYSQHIISVFLRYERWWETSDFEKNERPVFIAQYLAESQIDHRARTIMGAGTFKAQPRVSNKIPRNRYKDKPEYAGMRPISSPSSSSSIGVLGVVPYSGKKVIGSCYHGQCPGTQLDFD